MDLEQQLASIGLGRMAQLLSAELTITTKRSRFAVFKPKTCLWVQDGKLCLGHPCATVLLRFAPEEVLHVGSGVSVTPQHPLFQWVVEDSS